MHDEIYNSPLYYKTINDALLNQKNRAPDKIAYRFIQKETEVITYEDLYNHIHSLACKLIQVTKPFDRIILSAMPGLEFIIGFYACLVARTIAVPLIPPSNRMMAKRFLHVVKHADATLVLFDNKTMKSIHFAKLTSQFIPGKLKNFIGVNAEHTEFFGMLDEKKIEMINISEAKNNPFEISQFPQCKSTDIAFLQYTSGSTGNPKGVMITQANLLHNVEIIRNVIHHSSNSHMFSWLPPYHDMGLIAGIIEPLYMGITSTLMPTLDFIKSPSRWVEEIAHHRCTTTGAPNFAFELCALKTPDDVAQKLDLSCLEVAANGAEPLSASTISLFYKKFKKSGLRQGVILPCYGLAESTVMVSGKKWMTEELIISVDVANKKNNKIVLKKSSGSNQLLVSSGIPHLNIKIVNPDTLEECQAMEVGEIWIQGDSVAKGYFNNLKETELTFHAKLKNDNTSNYLRSGDLGFIYQDELFVCGRIKNMIIIRGQNYYPQDIESVVTGANPAIRKGGVVAYGSQHGDKETLTVVAELRQSTKVSLFPEILENIKSTISQEFHLSVLQILLVEAKSIPKTTSGKLQRLKCKELVETHTITPLSDYVSNEKYSVKPSRLTAWAGQDLFMRSGVEEQKAQLRNLILSVIADVLAINDNSTLNTTKGFFELGIDSMLAVETVGKLQNKLSPLIHLDSALLFNTPTIESLVNYLHDELVAGDFKGRGEPNDNHQADRESSKSLSQNSASRTQIRYMKFYHLVPTIKELTFPGLIIFNKKISYERINTSLRKIFERHPVLSYYADLKTLSLKVADDSMPLHRIHLKKKSELEKVLDDVANRHFEIDKPPLYCFMTADFDDKTYFIFNFHHFIFDALSLTIFLDELLSGLSIENHLKASQPLIVSNFSDFIIDEYNMYSDESSLKMKEAYWRNVFVKATPFYLQASPRHDKTKSTTAQMETAVHSALRKNIVTACQHHHITPYQLLFAAFIQACYQISGNKDIVIVSPTSGRFKNDYKRAIGPFSNLIPVRVQVLEEETIENFVYRVSCLLRQSIANEIPFDCILDNIEDAAGLFNHAFTLINAKINSDTEYELVEEIKLLGIRDGFHLYMQLIDNKDNYQCHFVYDSTIYSQSIIEKLATMFIKVLDACVNTFLNKDRAIDQFHFESDNTIHIAASFTSDALNDSLKAWLNWLSWDFSIRHAPYNQLFQELLKPNSTFNVNTKGYNIILLRPMDWIRYKHYENQDELRMDVSKLAAEFSTSLITWLQSAKVKILLILCPTASTGNQQLDNTLGKVEQDIINHLKEQARLSIFTSGDILSLYPVGDIYEPRSDQMAHIPYTENFYIALSTFIIRKIYGLSLSQQRFKVIAVDCDNTLWGGVLGEDGAQGINLSGGYLELQRFLKGQKEQGKLICIVSKNDIDDVKTVFAEHPDMLLKIDDITAWKVNWQSKVESLKSLSGELSLNLDSFIFIDDNPVECAQIESQYPGVFTIQFPSNPHEVTRLLTHLWVFEQSVTTDEDRKRTKMYQENRLRNEALKQSANFDDFLQSLNLDVSIEEVSDESIERAAQLSQRTNQFNTTTMRMNASDLLQYIQSGGRCFTVKVSDRFGDYGIVGIILLRATHQIIVDNLVLSCRVLGRGVEQAMLRELGKIANDYHVEYITVDYKKTAKNVVVHNFLENLPTQDSPNEQYVYSTDMLLNLNLKPPAHQFVQTNTENEPIPMDSSVVELSKLKTIAEASTSINRIKSTILANRLRPLPNQRASLYRAPRTSLEASMVLMWEKVLGVERIGIDDDFFDLGGTSIQLVQMAAKLNRITDKASALDMTDYLKLSTIHQLAQCLQSNGNEIVPAPFTQEESQHALRLSDIQTLFYEAEPDITIECNVIGRGARKVVLIGGLCCDLTIWNEQINYLKADHTIYILYPPGHGKSSMANAYYDLSIMAKHMIIALKAFHVSNALLVGWSLGSVIAQSLVIEDQDVFSQLILISATGRAMEGGNQTAQVFNDFKEINSNYPQIAFPYYSPSMYEFYLRVFEQFSLLPTLPKIKCPTLIVHGEQDERIPIHYSKELHTVIQHSQFITVAGGHYLPISNPLEINLFIRAFSVENNSHLSSSLQK